VVHGQPALLSQPHVLIGARRFAGNSKDGIASLEKAACHRIEELLMDRVADLLASSFTDDGESDPFPDQGDVTGVIEGQGKGFKRRRFAATRVGSSFVPER
jgi:hypothetical protein